MGNQNYEENPNSVKCKNPLTVRNIFTGTGDTKKLLTAQCHLAMVDDNVDLPPLELEAPWSRFVLFLLNDGKRVKANIPAEDVALIFEKTREAMQTAETTRALSPLLETNGNGNVGPEYTVRLTGKKFGGKTAASVLMDDPTKKKELYEQYEFLKSNLQKYPANQLMMDAIKAAIEKSQKGELKPIPAPVTVIYKEDVKFLVSDKDESGRCLVYSINISYTRGSDTPVAVQIGNSYCPMIESGGKKLPKLSEGVNQRTHSISLTEGDWFRFIRKLNKLTEDFESSLFFAVYKKAQTLQLKLQK